MLLAIDTSTEWSGLALYNAAGVQAEAMWRSGRQHTEQLLTQLDLLCRQLGVKPADLATVGVATGPGSWAGLRVGMSLAKALVVAQGIPIIGVPTTDVWAWSWRHVEQTLLVVIRLGRGRYAIAQYAAVDQPCAAPSAVQVYELAAVPVMDALYLGDIDAELQAHLGSVGHWATPADNVRRPAALAELAWARLADGAVDDVVGLEPIYLSSPVRGELPSGLSYGATLL
ncbi:MAG: tRNA (adenosine(37)-N6)-threonylcarbamoyltransferase complex dimerization subunit type 1 TsaB [Herpetosiphonaceae bacterium]|nr:tRNA (adenosine(37)-N6)-threonylcarbamoyltransferase complex dimerization subunit type 1 TsaB [Herpetosiphonaceae bacterium]